MLKTVEQIQLEFIENILEYARTNSNAETRTVRIPPEVWYQTLKDLLTLDDSYECFERHVKGLYERMHTMKQFDFVWEELYVNL